MNSFDGVWQADFGSLLGDRGLVLIRRDRILGCDNHYFYEGTFELEADNTIKAHVQIEHFAGQARPIFGPPGSALMLASYTAELQGVSAAHGPLQLRGVINGDSEKALVITLTRLMPVSARAGD